MVLRNSGRVGSRRFFLKDPLATRNTGARGFSRLGGYWKELGGGEKKDGRCENGEGRNAMQRDSAACFSHLNSHISFFLFSLFLSF